jgi:transcriptional regulator with XRE-family HTH domain
VEFGTSLRLYRERLTPQDAKIPTTLPRVRRVPGLRRDELAPRAGISEEHLKRLEQGRRRPSPSVVDALATALRLEAGEHARLRTLAGFAPPAGVTVPREITPAARRMLDRLTEVAACVCDATWTVLDGNTRWNVIACPPEAARGLERNMAWRIFTEAPTRVFRTPGHLDAFRAALVTDLRAAADRYPGDGELSGLITTLRTGSPEFGRLWHTVPPTTHDDDHLSIPATGVELVKDVLTLPAGDLRIVVLTAP